MLSFAVSLHTILTNAYTLFCFLLGFWALFLAVRNQPIGGQFWGALAVDSLLAAAILIVSFLLQLGGIPPARSVYYLYAIYFVIVLPGTYALLRGRDDRTAAWIYAAVILFTALASLTRSDLLTNYTAQLPG